jgi:hypothetical protein
MRNDDAVDDVLAQHDVHRDGPMGPLPFLLA